MLAGDGEHEATPTTINAAATALLLSRAAASAAGAVRVAYIDGQCVVNPTQDAVAKAKKNLLLKKKLKN